MAVMSRVVITLAFVLFVVVLKGQTLTIGSLTPHPSTCAANGSVEVKNISLSNLGAATVVKVFYSLEGIFPTTFSILDTESPTDKYNLTFVNVPGGNYTVKVVALLSDSRNVQSTATIAVSSSYKTMAVSVNTYVESLSSCDKTGVMYVRVIDGGQPATIRISNYIGTGTSPVGRSFDQMKTVSSNTNDYYFYDLPSGQYTFETTDNCGTTLYNGAVLNKVDPSTFTWFKDDLNNLTYFNWTEDCTLSIKESLSISTSVPNYSNLTSYYSTYSGMKIKVEYTDGNSAIFSIGTSHLVPQQYTKDHRFTGILSIIGPCGQTISSKNVSLRLSSLTSSINATNLIDAYAVPIPNVLTELGLLLITSRFKNESMFIGQRYRVTFNGITSSWKTITSTNGIIDTLRFATGVSNYKELFALGDPILKGGILEIETKCGGINTSYFGVQPPTISNRSWECSIMSLYVNQNSNGIVAMPAKLVLTNTVSGIQYTVDIPYWNDYQTQFQGNVPAGTYSMKLVGADGYEKVFTNITLGSRPIFDQSSEPQVNRYTGTCTERTGNWSISPVPVGARLRLISAPRPYFYDKILTSGDYDIFPDQLKIDGTDGRGVMGDYVFELTDVCGDIYTINAKQTRGYEVTSFAPVLGKTDCDGTSFTVDGSIKRWYNGSSTAASAYYYFLSGPTGFVKPSSAKVGDSIKLTLKGTYVVGITLSSTTCALRTDTIEFDGSSVEVDLNASFAYVCLGSSNNDGKIYAKAKNGIAPYTYYLSPKGTGGLGIENRSYIAKNTSGDFPSYNLVMDQEYDITIVDACKNVAKQTFKINYLSDYKIAYAESNSVCIGNDIQFRSMALPNPTFKWYKPGASIPFSTSANPLIPNAQFSDQGQYKVEITSELCTGMVTDVLYVDIEVQLPPTLTRTGGAADQYVCSGSPIVDIVYTWGGSATDVSITGLSSTYYTKNMSAKTLTIRGNIASNNSYVVETIGGCSDLSAKGTITVKAKPTATVSLSSDTNQSVCFGNAINTFYYTPTGATNFLVVTGLPPGVTGVFASNRLTISGTPTAKGTYGFSVVASTTDPLNPCGSTLYSGTIIVDDGGVLTLTSALGTDNQTVCYTNIGTITPITYTWSGAATDVSVTGISSSYYSKNTTTKTVTINRVAASVGVSNYTITTIGCKPTSVSGSITLLALPTLASIPNHSICKGEIPIITIPTTTSGYTYRLYLTSMDNTVISSSKSTGSSVTLAAKDAITTSTYYYVSVENEFGCISSSKTSVYVQVANVPAEPVLSSSIICMGADAKIIVSATSPTLKYSVYDSQVAGNLVVGPINGTGGNLELNCGPLSQDSRTFYVEVENTSGCIQTGGRTAITIQKYIQKIIYPDIRILACTNSPINLSQFLDVIDIKYLIWTTTTDNPGGVSQFGTILDPSKLVPGYTYKYFYKINNPCPPSQYAVLYLRIPKEQVSLDRGEIKICFNNAANIQLNQIIGISGGNGSWTCIPASASSYLSINATSPYVGAAVLNGMAIWNDPVIPFENGVKVIKIKYTPESNSCFSANTYYVSIVITDSIL